MSVSTLERVDWRAVLDDEPACGRKTCDRPATARIRWVCGCPDLACQPCLQHVTDRIAASLLCGRTVWRCSRCHAEGTARHLSDVMTVIPL